MSTTPSPTGELPITLFDIYEQLTVPFEPRYIELKPGATSKDKTKALALCYADPRAYQERLDMVVGPDNWKIEYRPVPTIAATVAMLCRLTLLGIIREDIGESPATDANAHTVCAAQAFKRACTMFGLGRYLYDLPQKWVAYDGYRIVDPEKQVLAIYREAGIPMAPARDQFENRVGRS